MPWVPPGGPWIRKGVVAAGEACTPTSVQDTRRVGQGFAVVSESIGAMVANCGLGQVKRITGPVGLPREFWAPP